LETWCLAFGEWEQQPKRLKQPSTKRTAQEKAEEWSFCLISLLCRQRWDVFKKNSYDQSWRVLLIQRRKHKHKFHWHASWVCAVSGFIKTYFYLGHMPFQQFCIFHWFMDLIKIFLFDKLYYIIYSCRSIMLSLY
jgi:hypothetical protein